MDIFLFLELETTIYQFGWFAHHDPKKLTRSECLMALIRPLITLVNKPFEHGGFKMIDEFIKGQQIPHNLAPKWLVTSDNEKLWGISDFSLSLLLIWF